METLSALDVALTLIGGIGGAVAFIALLIAALDRTKSAISREDGIEAFIRSFDSEQFESREDRNRRG